MQDQIIREPTTCFVYEAPPHAFPDVYPPTCSYDPFPIAPGKRTLRSPWLRTPWRQGESARHRPVDVAPLVAMFAGLSISGKEPETSQKTFRLSISPSPPCSRSHNSPPARSKRSQRHVLRVTYQAPSSTQNSEFAMPKNGHLISVPRRRHLPWGSKCGLPNRVPKHPPLHLQECRCTSSISTPYPKPVRPRAASATSTSSGSEDESPVTTPPHSCTSLSSASISSDPLPTFDLFDMSFLGNLQDAKANRHRNSVHPPFPETFYTNTVC